ncbi:hypothetical protein FA13DRAFT_200811 [Coprinellus micaceus]|uniref:Uncharacterized protein n=1 Tax=Coprinellus micaceus TaxID=71717 RepID=A0A4Y7SI13_COPMI|nr:hypothetical protein FA13DRAFT_200811 [Coprinellus micaceus]
MLHLLTAVVVYFYFKEKEPVDVPTVTALLVVVPTLSILLKNYLNLVSPVYGVTSCMLSFFAFYALLLSCMMAYRLSPRTPVPVSGPAPLQNKQALDYLPCIPRQAASLLQESPRRLRSHRSHRPQRPLDK